MYDASRYTWTFVKIMIFKKFIKTTITVYIIIVIITMIIIITAIIIITIILDSTYSNEVTTLLLSGSLLFISCCIIRIVGERLTHISSSCSRYTFGIKG